ncbi:MAG: leucine-rich repeat protein [Clostridia bacterium]|nr:leucine-rich repeat protein [Clostridia bacterium]
MPGSVSYIGRCAFADCNSVTSVYIPNSVKHIGYAGFDCDYATIYCEQAEYTTDWDSDREGYFSIHSPHPTIKWGQAMPY